jgi:hypothetical protein
MAINRGKRISELPALSPASLDTTFVVGISGSTTYKISVNQLTSSLDTTFATDLVTNALSSSLSSKLSTESFNQYTASFTASVVSGTISGSSQLTSSFDQRYVVSGSITQTTWDSIASKPTDIISSSNQITELGYATTSSLNTFTQSYYGDSSSLDSRLDILETYSSSQQVPTSSYSFRTSQVDVYVKNITGTQIDKGKVVRIIGATGDNPLISLADPNTEHTSANSLGITIENIPNDSFGLVITEGILLGVNTNGMTAGQLLYLGNSGSFTTTPTIAPKHGVRLGEVLREQQNNGSIYVRIDNGSELGEAHDVIDTSTTSSYGDILMKSGSVWINNSTFSSSIDSTIKSLVNATSSFETNGRAIVSGSSQLTSSYDTRYTLSGSVQPLPSNLISSSAQITAFGFVSSSTTIPAGTISGSSQLTSSFDTRYAISASFVSSSNLSSIQTITSASYAALTPVSGTLYIIIG